MRRSFRSALLLASLALAGAAHAQVTTYDLFRTNVYTQDGAATAPLTGTFLAARIFGSRATDYAGASFDARTMNDEGETFGFSTAYYADAAALEADFPQGTYEYAVDAESLPADSATLDDTTDLFSADKPLIPEYDALRSAIAGQGFTLNVGAFAPGAGANASRTFYTVFDSTAGTFLVDGSHDTTAFTFDIAPGTLVAGHDYIVDVSFSSRLATPNAGFGNAFSIVGYDQRTLLAFTPAAVPEPASLAALGLGAATLLRRRRR